MLTCRCPGCNVTFRHEDAEAVFCPKCKTTLCEIVEEDSSEEECPDLDRKGGKIFLNLWISHLFFGGLVNLLLFMLFGLWASAAAMILNGWLFGKACIFSGIPGYGRLIRKSTIALLLAFAFFYLLPALIYSLVEIDVMWMAGLLFFGFSGIFLGSFHGLPRAGFAAGAFALALFFFYAEPQYWFYSIPVDKEWSRAVNLTQTEPLFAKVGYGSCKAFQGKLYYQSGKATVAYDPDLEKWTGQSCRAEEMFPVKAGLPVVIPYRQNCGANYRGDPPAAPELILKDAPEGPVSRYPIDIKTLYPEYNAPTTENVCFTATPVRVLEDGRLYFTYTLTWKRFSYGPGNNIRSSGDANYLSPGTIRLDRKSGRCEVTRGREMQYSNLKSTATDDKLMVFFRAPYHDKSRYDYYSEFDFNTGKWSEREPFFMWESTNTLYRSFFWIEEGVLHCILGDEHQHRVRAPLALLGMDGYRRPGKILYLRRDLQAEKWSGLRNLSRGIKFMSHPQAAQEGKTFAVVWGGKQRGEGLFASDVSSLYYAFSMDGGIQWTGPLEIPVPPGLKVSLSRPAVMNGILYLFFTAVPEDARWYGDREGLFFMTRKLPEAPPQK